MKLLLPVVLSLGLLVSCVQRGQDAPCQNCQQTSIKDFEAQHEAQFTAAMQQTLDQLFKEKSKGIDDPDKIKAMKVLAKTDAAKSYAFTQIYGVSAKHCGSEVAAGLESYRAKAANIIALGHYYYQHGIDAKLGDRDFSQSGEALTTGLKEMTNKLDDEHEAANAQQLTKKCKAAEQALGTLTYLYGGF